MHDGENGDRKIAKTRIWIIGGGKFGRLALERLSRIHSPENLLVVDLDQRTVNDARRAGVEAFAADGVDFLAGNLDPDSEVRWIVPSVPVHLAYEWLMRRLGGEAEAVFLDDGYTGRLPCHAVASNGAVYASYADFTCPDDCSEPADICTVTGLPRRGSLYAQIRETDWPGYKAVVLRSRQLAPGVGGYRPADLFDLEKNVRAAGGRVLIATACRCHGVINGLSFCPEKEE